MGLLEKYQKDGSSFDKPNPAVNIGATKQSKLHADGEEGGYSVGNKATFTQTIAALNAYDDGDENLPPPPSGLDLEFSSPISSPQHGHTQHFSPTKTYKDSAPEGSSF